MTLSFILRIIVAGLLGGLIGLEREIGAMEQRLSEYDSQIAETGSDYQALARLMDERQALEAELDEKMAQWAELSPD